VKRWLNRFVSVSAIVLVAACHSAPPRPAPAVGAHAGSAAAAPGAAAPGASAAPANNAPVPEGARQQYAEALQLMKAGRTTDAELAFKRMTVSYPDLAGPYLNLGLIYMQGAHLPEAEASFKDALDRNPSNAIAGNELGIVERKMGKFAEAETAYQRTIAAEPNYAPAYLNLGVLYDLYLAEPQKALEQFEHYIQIAGENKQVAGWVVELRKRVGAPAAAKKEAA
jgi:tetratricopeptide (TPR) repeat protein